MQKIFNRLSYIYLFIAFVFILFISFVSGCGSQASEQTSKKIENAYLQIYALDVGQGDSFLIKAGDEFSLIDAGLTVKSADLTGDKRRYVARVKQILEEHNAKGLKYVIITHPDADHYIAFESLAKAVHIGKVFDNGDNGNSRSYTSYLKAIEKQKIPHVILSTGDELKLGEGVKFNILASSDWVKAAGEQDVDRNNRSIVGKLEYQNFSMLFTGDAGFKEEKFLTQKYGNKLKSDILKVGHHGSKYSSDRNFLTAVKPRDAIISVGLCNEYGHPTEDALNRINKVLSGKIYTTANDHEIVISSDGSSYNIETTGQRISTCTKNDGDKKRKN